MSYDTELFDLLMSQKMSQELEDLLDSSKKLKDQLRIEVDAIYASSVRPQLDVSSFTVRVHHSGEFDPNKFFYLDGKVDEMVGCNKETFSINQISDFVKGLGCKEMLQCWYVLPKKKLCPNTLIGLRTEENVSLMLEWVKLGVDTFSVYITHKSDEVENESSTDVVIDDTYKNYLHNVEEHSQGNESDSYICEDHMDQIASDPEVEAEVEGKAEAEVECVKQNVSQKPEFEVVSDLGYNSDTLDSIASSENSEEESIRKRVPEFNSERDMANPEFKLEMKFADSVQFRKAVREYAIKNKKRIKLVQNEKFRLRAKCEKPCPWFVFVSKVWNSDTLQVKTINPVHVNCRPVFKNNNINSTWLANNYLEQMRTNPSWPVEALIDTVRVNQSVDVSRSQAYRAKWKAQKRIGGDHRKQFGQLWNYCKELKRAMPGTTTQIDYVEDASSGTVEWLFRRMYCCLEPLKEGFKAGCRPIVCIDGCFLKGPWPGQLLTAVGLDANDGMWPIAYAVVEKECKSSWKWFLEILVGDLGIVDPKNWTFMSDQQKGLDRALEAVIPEAQHRYCVRHLHANFKKEHGGKLLKDAFWKCARASTVDYYNRAVQEICELKEEVAQWFLNAPDPSHWSRSHFSSTPKSDLLINNHCEIFNSFILQARDKPIITMFETIRKLLMNRIRDYRDKMRAFPGTICPRILQKLDVNKEFACGFIALWTGGPQFQVTGPNSQVVVDIEAKTCSCRQWQLSGVPCPHAIACFNYKGLPPEDFVHECYTTVIFYAAYSHIILATTSEDLWPHSSKKPLQVPVPNVQTGRKKKARNKKNDDPNSEGKMGKFRSKMTCGHCGQVGHNKRSCRNMGTTTKESESLKRRKEKNKQKAAATAAAATAAASGNKKKRAVAGTSKTAETASKKRKVQKIVAESSSQPVVPRRSPRKKMPNKKYAVGGGSQP